MNEDPSTTETPNQQAVRTEGTASEPQQQNNEDKQEEAAKRDS
jgi:hypothetical protein